MLAPRLIQTLQVKDVLEWLEGAVLCSHDPSGEAGVGVACKTVARKLLVFAHHRGVMNLLHEGLAQAMGRAL